MSQDKPVAAQKPIAYIYKIYSAFDEDTPVWTFDPDGREVLETKPLYDHAAPCARCAELEQDLLTAYRKVGTDQAKIAKAEKDAAYRLDTLKEVREALGVANVTPNGPINDTIWYSNCETLFDFMDAAIAKARQKGIES